MSYEIKHANLLKNCVDIHLHVSPSLIPRSMDIAEVAARADKYGYKAIVHKDHHALSANCASLIKKHLFANSSLQILGSICLNNSVGGLKREVVEAAIGYGAKIIWLPTVSAINHIQHVAKTGKFPRLAKGITITETPLRFVNEQGECRQEIITIFELIKNYPDVVLAAGHGDPDEINIVVEQASQMGLCNRFIINHPTFLINATLQQVKHWASLGCYIESTAALTAPSSPHNILPAEHIVEIIRTAGPAQCILSSDYGQTDLGDPIEGMDDFFDVLLKNGITEDELMLMSNTIPSKLLGLPL